MSSLRSGSTERGSNQLHMSSSSCLSSSQAAGDASRYASVSNLANRQQFSSQWQQLIGSAAQRGTALPEELETRSGWTVLTEPALTQLTTAIIEDNYNSMDAFLPQLKQLSQKLTGFKIEITTRSGVRIACRSMFLGHLLCLCASPRVLQLLLQQDLLSTRMFAKRVDLCIDFDPGADSSKLPEDSVFAEELRKFHWRSVPCHFMFILRDSFDSFEWLLKQQFLRKLTDTDECGRNVLHAAIEMESPLLLTRLITKEKCCSHDTLQLLMRQKEKQSGLTPLLKACASSTVAMLVLILQNLPMPFLLGELDASGVGQSIISAVIRNVKDSAIALELVQLLLKRGATPDTAFFDKRCCIDVLIAAEHFSGHDLCHLVMQLVSSNAKVDLGVMVRCLSCTFRTDAEISELALELLEAAGSVALTDPHQAEMQEMGEESFDMEFNVVVQMLRNPQITPHTVQHLLTHFSRHINISAIFPTVHQLGKALVQGIWTELHMNGVADDDESCRAPLSPQSLGQVLRSLARFTSAANRDAIKQQRYKDSLLHQILNALFRESDFESSLLPKEKLTRLLPEYLIVMEEAGLDMNASCDGRVSMFAAFEATCPGWLSLSLLRRMPETFQLNVRDKRGNNLAVVLMRTFSKKYKMLLAAMRVLKKLNFSMKSEVLGRYNLLMAFVQICGSGFKALEAEDDIDEEKAGHFVEVFNFLISEGVDPLHSIRQKDVDDHTVTVSALSLAMSQGVSLLVLELLRRYPLALAAVKPRTLLRSLHEFPELIEMLNSKLQCREQDAELVKSASSQNFLSGQAKAETASQAEHRNGVGNAGPKREMIRTHWREYVRKNHGELLKLANEEEDFQDCVLLVYDYFQECKILAPPEEEEEEEVKKPEEKAKKKSEGSGKVRKKVEVESVTLDQRIFLSPRVRKNRMNSKLMLIIADNPVMKAHPMISEYMARFYVKALLMAVFMNLFHLVFLALFMGHVTWVTLNFNSAPNTFSGFHLLRPVQQYRVTGFFDCRFRRCEGGSSFFAHRVRDCVTDPSNSSCNICTGRLLVRTNCLDPNPSLTFSRCPVYVFDRGGFWITPVQYILIGLSAFSFLKEAFQLVTSPRAYFGHLMQNLVEMTMYLTILLSSINVSECPWSSGFRENWQYDNAIVAVFLAWSMMFFYLSRFQAFSTYVMMFYTSVKTGVGLLFAFMCIIIGYVQVFHMLLKNQYAFRDTWVSFLKVIEMLVGGLDYNDIFDSIYDKDSGTIDRSDQKLVYNDFFTRVVYFSFIITMCVVLMNLFIGLIVGDVEKINQEAEVKTWTNCVGFIDIAHDMLQWSVLLQEKFKERRQRRQNGGGDGGNSADGGDSPGGEMRNVNLKSVMKHPALTTLMGLVSGDELGSRLLACEKRKVKVKGLTKILHNKLPFLYSVYDQSSSQVEAEAIEFQGAESEHGHAHSDNHSCRNHSTGNPIGRLAVPEDVQLDDPFLRQKRDAVMFPNRLNRLRQQQHASMMDSISENLEN